MYFHSLAKFGMVLDKIRPLQGGAGWDTRRGGGCCVCPTSELTMLLLQQVKR